MRTTTEQSKTQTFKWEHIEEHPIMSHVSVHVFCAYEMLFDAKWHGELAQSHFDRLYFVTDGEAQLRTDTQSIRLRPGCCYLIPRDLPHRHSCPSQVSMHWCHFRALINDTRDLFQEMTAPIEVPIEHPSEYREVFDKLVQAMQEQAPSGYLERAALLLSLIQPHLKLSHPPSPTQSERRNRLLPVLRHIDEHLANPIRIEDLSALLGLNPEYFSRAFRREFGVPPKRYLLQRRIQHAQRLLCISQLQVQEIATRCGFDDPYHFSKVFKQIAGLSPSLYRRLEQR
jgi:AraC family transcriptional regulator of arabinose operon